MINLENVLTTLWGKVSKPVTNILIGMTFLFFATDELAWLGLIFLAIGVGSFLDKRSYLVSKLWKDFQGKRKIKDELKYLTDGEKAILKLMVRYNKRIMRENDFEEVLCSKRPGRRERLPSEIYDIFTSLADKRLVYYNCSDFGGFNLTAPETIWKVIKNFFKDDFNIGDKKERIEGSKK